jgi:hypothetical protein
VYKIYDYTQSAFKEGRQKVEVVQKAIEFSIYPKGMKINYTVSREGANEFIR